MRYLLSMIFCLWASCALAFPPGFIGAVTQGVSGGGTFTPPPILDNFNRSDGALGSSWTGISGLGMPVIVSNQVGGGATRTTAWYNASSFSSDQIACAKFTTLADSAGVAVRIQSDIQTMYLVVTNGSNLLLRENNAGTMTQLGTEIANAATNDTVCLSASGSSTVTLTVRVNGAVVRTDTDSSAPITGGSPGLLLYSTSGRIDDFAAGDL